jgi:hypothetical protein
MNSTQKIPSDIYQQQLKELHALLQKHLKKRSLLGWTRFGVFIGTALIAWKVFVTVGLPGLAVVVTGIALLLYLITIDVNNNRRINNIKTLIRINEEEIQTLNHKYYERFDGSIFTPATHDYANDLDLFGKSSLFQYINRCFTEQGRSCLAQNFLEPLSVPYINERHESIKELAPLVDWRQQWQAYAMQTAIKTETQKQSTEWLAEKEEHFISPVWKVVVWIYSIITLLTALAAIFGYISLSQFTTLYLIFFFTSIALGRNATKAYAHLSGIVKEINTLQLLVDHLESRTFKSILVNRLQQQIKPAHSTASSQIQELATILDRFDLRLNLAGPLFLNAFLLWDVRQMIALNSWRRRNKELLPKWFDTIAEVETLNSLATLHFNQPLWCLPQLTDKHFDLEGKEIGHPLIPDVNRVNNDFTLQGPPKIGLITGSNMAGKSTFLRSLGVNIALAQMGAPVCARSFRISPVRLMSSMRIADNLAENTSTFYAELKKLKTIIDAVNRHEHVFILLDEILRGTNSFDRHKGSEALIAQLIRENAVAVIATHDVELADLEKQYSQAIENYNFDVQVSGEELYFDYKLKHGVCTSLNASILMKKIGIDL